jgi:hypothetical protein
MQQVQQFPIAEDGDIQYHAAATSGGDGGRSETSAADRMTAEERKAMNAPGHAAFGDPLVGEIPAAARHVRPEELLVALAAIEARRGEAVVETQPLGQGLAQTDTTASAEEVWVEINALRENQIQRDRSRKRRWGKKPLWLQVGVAVVCLGATAAALRVLLGDIKTLEKNNPTKTAAVTPPVPKERVKDYGFIFPEKPGLVSLANLPQEKPFWLDTSDAIQLSRLMNGDNYTLPAPRNQWESIYVDLKDENNRRLWNVLVRGDKVYIRGWVSIPEGGGDSAPKGKLQLFNRPDHPELPQGTGRQVSVSARAFADGYSSSTSNDFSQISYAAADPRHLDWSAWEPLPLPPANRDGIHRSSSPHTILVSVGFGKYISQRIHPHPAPVQGRNSGRAIRVSRSGQ